VPLTINVDLTSIEFPSDRLSILDVRKLFPQHLDSPPSSETKAPSLDDLLGTLVGVERKLAESAFDAASGRTGRWARYRDSQREALASEYVRFGLAQGPNHADQLIRDFEARAANQSRGLGGREA
jgi:hypothetical protein